MVMYYQNDGCNTRMDGVTVKLFIILVYKYGYISEHDLLCWWPNQLSSPWRSLCTGEQSEQSSSRGSGWDESGAWWYTSTARRKDPRYNLIYMSDTGTLPYEDRSFRICCWVKTILCYVYMYISYHPAFFINTFLDLILERKILLGLCEGSFWDQKQ